MQNLKPGDLFKVSSTQFPPSNIFEFSIYDLNTKAPIMVNSNSIFMFLGFKNSKFGNLLKTKVLYNGITYCLYIYPETDIITIL